MDILELLEHGLPKIKIEALQNLDSGTPDNIETPQWSKHCMQLYTLTLKPSWYKYKSAYQYRQCVNIIKIYCDKRKIKYFLIPELTKDGNIHFHGFILGKNDNFNRLVKNHLNRNIGYVHNRHINNYSHAVNYILKDKLWLIRPYEIVKSLTL